MDGVTISDDTVGSYDWWYQVTTQTALYGYSETLDDYYATQGITILHTPWSDDER